MTHHKTFSLLPHLAAQCLAAALAAGVAMTALAGSPAPELRTAAHQALPPAPRAVPAASGKEKAAEKAEKAEKEAKLEAWRENMTAYLSRAYRVPRSRIEQIIEASIEAGRQNDIDPLLLLSITAAESTFNPKARNARSGASGLMQVLPAAHAHRFKKRDGGIFDIETNLQVGAELLRELIDKTGSLQRGLKHYMGAALLSHDSGYGNRVTREHSRLKLAAGGDVSQAVSLHRSRMPAESFEQKISGTFSEFKEWLTGAPVN